MFKTLVDAETVSDHLADPSWVIVDCRFDLADTEAGWAAYEKAHIPGAVYAHLDEDLSGPPLTDKGRHPLPSPAALTRLFGRLGIDETKQVVVYDNANGTYASRLWWMLRYMGHEAVAVLDGGWPAWEAAGLPTKAGSEW
jgi:thiosulfate/3-mercaptopyruvate sulfurtransferase